MRRVVSGLLIVAAAVGLSTCSSTDEPEDEWSDDPCSAAYQAHPHLDIIGPAGGTVSIYQSAGVSHPYEGFDLVVPAGAWAECWEVEIDASLYGWDTPAYPGGFLPVLPAPEGSLEFSIFRQTRSGGKVYAPDSMYVELAFPIASIPPDSRDYPFAFVFDSTAWDWRILLPDELDDDQLTVHVSDWKQQWSFGSVDLAEIDVQRYLTPALADRVGSDTWSRIQQSLDSLYSAVVSTPASLDCAGLDLLEDLFASLQSQAGAKLQEIDARIQCGDCDATTGQFWEEWEAYVQEKQWTLFVDIAADVVGQVTHAHWFVDLGTSLITGAILDAMGGNYACNYACFEEAIDWSFYLYLAGYAAAGAIVYVVDWYRANYTFCPAPPADKPGIRAGSAFEPPGGCLAEPPGGPPP